MLDLITAIPGKKKVRSGGWYSFNAVCCHHKGHKPDKRSRGGVIVDTYAHTQTYHCFNCGFKCKFVQGKAISGNLKRLLEWCGHEDSTIFKWSMESLKDKPMLDLINRPILTPKLEKKILPEKAIRLDPNNSAHQRFTSYIKSRGLNPNEFEYMISPDDKGRNKHRIIMPYKTHDKVVGYISRYLDDESPKYIKEQQPGYIFGLDQQNPLWSVALVFEGTFDAIALNGCAVLHDDISPEQISQLHQLHRTIIVVPDQDPTGMKICNVALEAGFKVSIPNWDKDVKDANDAVKRYGRIPTLMSILRSATNNRIKIHLATKRIIDA